MLMSLQEISDRFAIMDLLTLYCTLIDSNQIDRLNEVFSSNALIDYSEAGGPNTIRNQ